MTKKTFEPILSAHLIEKFQRRLSSYLNDHEYRHNIQAKEVAEKIGITSQKFSYVKSAKKPYGRFISSLDLLARFARLEQLTIVEFLEYLEGERDKDGASTETKIYDWQKSLIGAFEPLKTVVRNSFVDLCKDSARDGANKLEALVEIANILQNRDLETIKAVRDALKRLT